MSDAFAIAAVTVALRELLQRGVMDAQLGSALSANAKVVASSPDRIQVLADADVRLSVFLCQVSRNAGWTNARMPARSFEGVRVDQPYLAIDLTYLISAHGYNELDAEILLGHALQVLHETPGLSRKKLRVLFSETGGTDLPANLRAHTSQLAEQLEAIKLSLRYPNLDDISKLWSSLNTHYRPSFLCDVSALLIESKQLPRVPLSVLSVGADGRGPGVKPNLGPQVPSLLGLRLPELQPAIESDGSLELFASHVAGTDLRVTLRNERLDLTLRADAATITPVTPLDFADYELAANPALRMADTKLVLSLSVFVPAANLLAGNYQIVISLLVDGSPRTTNSLPLAVAPSFATFGGNVPVVTVGAGRRELTVRLTTAPAISPRQRATLIVGTQVLRMEPSATNTTQPEFKCSLTEAVVAGPYVARLRVDDVESLYITRRPPLNRRPPELDPTQRIVVP